MSTLSHALLQSFVGVECPECGYALEIQLVDVRAQVYRHCPCCRVRIHLRDGGGSVYGVLEDIDNGLRNLADLTREPGQ
jgi:ribosomal protein S27E